MPLMGFLGIFLMQKNLKNALDNSRNLALFVSCATFLFSVAIFFQFDSRLDIFQLVEKYSWLPMIGMRYHLGVDGISICFVLLSTFMSLIAVISSFHSIKTHPKTFYMNILILEFMLIGSFISLDMIMFFIFFEGSLIPMFMIIGLWGGENRVYASFKIVLYTLTGSILMLIAIVAISFQMGSTSIKLASHFNFSMDSQHFLFLAFFISFAVKTPMIPVHTWLPDAHVQAPAAGSILLAAVLLKLGGYGFLRFSLPMFPEACYTFAPFIQGLSVVAIIYASLVALAQTDLKKVIAYSSIAHMGYVTLGIFSLKHEGITGAMYQMLSHGVISGALFMCVGILYHQTHTREIKEYGGVVGSMPDFTVLFFLLTLGAIGLPGTSGFVGEILVLLSAYSSSLWLVVCAGGGIILGAVYSLTLFGRIFWGQIHNKKVKELVDIQGIEKIALVSLVLIMLVMGVYPKMLMRVFDNSIKDITSILEGISYE